MDNNERDKILNTYEWIKVKKYDGYEGNDMTNPNVDWKSEYKQLMKHHKEETEFLINKIREIVKNEFDKI